MIKLGVSWFSGIERIPDVTGAVDFVELPIERYRELPESPHKPIILHNERLLWSLATPGAVDARWSGEVDRYVRSSGTPWFSIHLGFSTESVRFENHMLPLSEPLDRETLAGRFIANINDARDACPVPLIVENLDYCPEGAYEHVCEPTFIREVIEETGVGLLLDIGHLQVSASWLGFSVADALDVLPLDKVVEVHISSPREIDSSRPRLDDAHETLLDRDLDILREVLQRANPRVITLEYRRDPAQIVVELIRIREVLNG